MSAGKKKNSVPQGGCRTPVGPVPARPVWLFRFTLLVLPFILLGVVEVCLRIGGYGYNPDFFRRVKIGGEDCYVQNEDFSYSFFPRETVRNPGPVRFPAHKSHGTFRVFIFGESAAMGDPSQSFAPYRYLEMLLRDKYPERKFEFINVAFTAINSHVILPLARECASHEGDLWVIYMGNNEMVGPFGAATVFGRKASSLLYARLVTGVQRLRIGQLLMQFGHRASGSAQKPMAWGGMGMFLENQVAPDSPRKETVYRNFQRNLHDIVRAGVKSGAKVLLNTVAVNLKDCPPFMSTNSSRVSPAVQAQFEDAFAKAGQAQSQQQYQTAVEFFAQAARVDTSSAELQFRWAECLLAVTNLAAAREHFQLACDNDALPFRADSRINAAIRDERERTTGTGLLLFDAAAALAVGSATWICGEETFYEHVHFDFDGRYRLARAWAEQIEPLLGRNTNAWGSQAACERLLGLSDWNRAQTVHFMVERMQMPPLASQPNNVRRRGALEARINQWRAQMNQESIGRTRAEFRKLLEQRPDDYFLHENCAVFLELAGDLAGAAAEWQKFLDLLPHDCLGYYQAGRLLITQQRYAEAEVLLRVAIAIRPSRTEAWIELGNALALQKKYPEALAKYETALKQEPNNPQTLLRRGRVLRHMDRHQEAIESYRAAIRLNPSEALLHDELGVELAAAGDSNAAGAEFGEAARLNPDNVAARFNYGAWLLKQKQWDAAQREFEAVIRLEPGNVRARKNLAGLQAMKQTAQ